MVGQRLLNLPDHLGYVSDPGDEDFEVNGSQLTKRVRHLTSVPNHFWKRWRLEYLSELRESHQHSAKTTPTSPSVTKGEVVIDHDDALPRGLWKLWRIQEVLTGHDGLPWAALVRVASRDCEHILLKRPLQLLYSLEIHETELSRPSSGDVPTSFPDALVSTPVERGEVTNIKKPQMRCPAHAAAERAKAKRRVWIQEPQNQAKEDMELTNTYMYM